MQSNTKIAIFDFCETLANFQTADAFVHYIRKSNNDSKMCRKEKLRVFLKRYRILDCFERLFRHSSLNKRLVLWQLKGMYREDLDYYAKKYYENVVKVNLIRPVLEELVRLRNEGWTIVIASAGYESYLKYFCMDYSIPLHHLISVRIKFVDSICQGVFDGGDRLWDKTNKLDLLFNREKIESVAYSDSISDLPLLQWASHGVVVRRKDKKQWSNNYNFKEIVWQAD